PALTILTGCYAALWALGRRLCPVSSAEKVDPGEAAPETMPGPTFRTVFCSLTLMALVGSAVLAPSYFGFFYEGAGTHSRVGELSREVALSENALTTGAL